MRAAVVIGVDRVGGGLTRLQAAASGASEVAQWLRRSDYEVHLFTDRDAPVARSSIFCAVTSLVEAGTVKRLVIYFAGHGFLNGPLDEYWLLSGAPIDAAEAVNVTSSAAMARYRGIPEIVFISDACRVAPMSNVHAGINGVSIFPNLRPSPRSAAIDFYYGAQPGDPAHERTSTEAEGAHGLFTRELLDAHKAAPAEASLKIGDQTYVRNDWLQRTLGDRVSARAERISLRLTQLPDAQIQIRDGYIALNEGIETGLPQSAASDPVTAAPGASGAILDGTGLSGGDTRPVARGTGRGMPRTAAARPAARKPGTAYYRQPAPIEKAARTSAQLRERVRTIKDAWETSAASVGDPLEPTLTCVGDTIDRFALAHGLLAKRDQSRSGSGLLFRMTGPASQLAIQFADGSGMLIPILRDFACEIVRQEGRTLSVGYSWLQYREPGLAELRAEVLGAASLGLLDRDLEATRDLARRLRRGKRYDPTLGLVAALAYVLAGDAAGATSVRSHMRLDLGVDLFDSWLLGGAGDGPPVHPSLPLLSQTWSLLDVLGSPIADDLKRLRRVPGFWSVFDAASMDMVMRLAQDRDPPGNAR